MSKKLRWGILSTASIALSAFLPGMANSARGEVVAIASRNVDKANKVAEDFLIPRSYGSYEALLSDPDVDAVYIPLPNHLHKEWTLKAAKAGKHVLCEKPAALKAEDAIEMVEGCKQAGVLFAEAFMYRHHPKHRRLKEIIESGELGEIQSIHGHFTYNELADTTDNVRYQKKMGGGALYDVGCYPISAARMILEQEPLAVTVQAHFSPEYDIDVTASGLIEFPDDVGLTFDCGMEAAPRCFLEVVGTSGRIEMPLAFGWERDAEAPQLIIHNAEGEREERLGVISSFGLEADAFATAVLDGTELLYPPQDAIYNMKVVEACLQSARTSSRVEL